MRLLSEAASASRFFKTGLTPKTRARGLTPPRSEESQRRSVLAASHRLLDVAVGRVLFDPLAFVVFLLSFGDGDRHFDEAARQMHVERDQREALLL